MCRDSFKNVLEALGRGTTKFMCYVRLLARTAWELGSVLPHAQARVVERRERTAQLRIDLSRCTPHGDVRYLRNRDVESMSRIDSEAAIPIGAVDVEVVVGRGRSRGRRWTGWTRDSQPVAKTHEAFILANASCIGSAETTIIPSNGESISKEKSAGN
jgi:hypothetical protein